MNHRKGAKDLIDKATTLAGVLLEFSGVKNGKKAALHIVNTGKAYKKLREIIEAQGGNPDVKPSDLVPGPKTAEFKSACSGRVLWISNKDVDIIARDAGAPKDKEAGMVIMKKLGDKVKRGDVLFKLYARKTGKFNRALKLAEELDIMRVGKERKMELEKLPAKKEEEKYFILER